MIQITKLVLSLTFLAICCCNSQHVTISYSPKKDAFTVHLGPKYFQKMRHSKRKITTLPYELSSPALNQTQTKLEFQQHEYISSLITYKFVFEIQHPRKNYFEVIPCKSNQHNVRVAKVGEKKSIQDEVLMIFTQKTTKSICLKVMDVGNLNEIGRIKIPLYHEVYAYWGHQDRFGFIHKNVKVGEQLVIRLHISNHKDRLFFYWQDPAKVIGNPKSILKMSKWFQSFVIAKNFRGYVKNPDDRKNKTPTGNDEFRLFVAKPGITTLRFVQRDIKHTKYPISVVIIKIVAHK